MKRCITNQLIRFFFLFLPPFSLKKRDILTRTKQVRDALRIENVKLRQKCGLLGNEPLLRDYEQRKEQVIMNKTCSVFFQNHSMLITKLVLIGHYLLAKLFKTDQQPIRGTVRIWVELRHLYGMFRVQSHTVFQRGKVKIALFSLFKHLIAFERNSLARKAPIKVFIFPDICL